MALSTSIDSYYKFDASNSNDSVGTANGTDSNISYVAGKINNGASFNGTSSAIVTGDLVTHFGNTGLATNTNPLTFACWVKRAGTSGQQNFFQGRKISGAQNPGIDFEFNSLGNLTVRFTGQTSGQDVLNSTAATFTDTTAYHHYALVYDGSSSVTVYYDGAAVSGLNPGTRTQTWSLSTSDANLDLGAFKSFASVNWLNGIMDEVGIWARALSSTEIIELWANGGARQWPFGQNFLPMM